MDREANKNFRGRYIGLVLLDRIVQYYVGIDKKECEMHRTILSSFVHRPLLSHCSCFLTMGSSPLPVSDRTRPEYWECFLDLQNEFSSPASLQCLHLLLLPPQFLCLCSWAIFLLRIPSVLAVFVSLES